MINLGGDPKIHWAGNERGKEKRPAKSDVLSTVIFNYRYSFQCKMVLSYSVTAETASERPGSGLR